MPHAREMAIDELSKMGPMKRVEKIVLSVFIGALALWATSQFTHMNATGVGMIAVMVLLLTNALTWQDVLQEKGAWDTMFWMGSLITLASALAKSGFIGYASRVPPSMKLVYLGLQPLVYCVSSTCILTMLSLAYLLISALCTQHSYLLL